MNMQVIVDDKGAVRGTIALDDGPGDPLYGTGTAMQVQLRAALRTEGWKLVSPAAMQLVADFTRIS